MFTPPQNSPLRIPASLLAAMVVHCEREYPLEACGLLSGTDAVVNAVHTMRNVLASEVRYAVDPLELIEINRQLRDRHEDILALYHSHPRTAAIPSATDMRENYWGAMPRIIVSLSEAKAVVKIWRLNLVEYVELPWDLIEND